MQNIVHPKCPYCKKELKNQGFGSPLQGLYGEYCSDMVVVTCPFCNKQYEVRKQTRFLTRKHEIKC